MRSRFPLTGILVTTALVVVAMLLWRSPQRSSPPEPASEITRRGGQLVAAIRVEPRSLNRLVVRSQVTELLTLLTQGRLIRVNRATLDVEPWLAQSWESAPDGRTHRMRLRPGVVWSDGTPFTSADVLFTLDAIFDPRTRSVLADSLTLAGQPIRADAPDAHSIVFTYPGPSGLGIRLLDNLPIFPKHRLAEALRAGTVATAWPITTPPSDLAGTGPFVVREYQPGQRVVLDRNPRYWRRAPDGTPLPYLDRLVLEIVPDPSAELLRLTSGELDLVQDAIQPEDFVAARRAERDGVIRIVELGVSPDVDVFWFCLNPESKRGDRRFDFARTPEFRQAISHAVDREEFANVVFLGEAVPVWGPITSGNKDWFTPNLPRYPPDIDRARELLERIGLADRNGNGVVEDRTGTEARFTVITQKGPGWYARGTSKLKEHVARIGVALDIVFLDGPSMQSRIMTCDYDALYMRVLTTDLDPAGNLDFWLSSGSAHFWNPDQRAPATAWERQIDALMLDQASSLDPEQRRQLFDQAQRVFAENLPALYFAAPRLHTAHSARVTGIRPSVLRPPILWNADEIGVAAGGVTR
jgi:peptide/nickel transport system substrate-binding protein